MNFDQRVLICTCTHSKRDHVITKRVPSGPCHDCGCLSFTPEPVCRCGHGKKAHAKGPCHEGHGCREFRTAA